MQSQILAAVPFDRKFIYLDRTSQIRLKISSDICFQAVSSFLFPILLSDVTSKRGLLIFRKIIVLNGENWSNVKAAGTTTGNFLTIRGFRLGNAFPCRCFNIQRKLIMVSANNTRTVLEKYDVSITTLQEI
uniref:Uncharacterized protein n=1 Tax=Megaselia scalaris TaxID=36166 RepID=T1GXW9_MEGSC